MEIPAAAPSITTKNNLPAANPTLGVPVMRITTNENKLVEKALLAEITNPPSSLKHYLVSAVSGEPLILPGTGGINYTHRVGDNCIDIVGDHVEPGVSVSNFNDNIGPNTGKFGLTVFSCIGNEATVVTGEAKGKKGIVTGKHGGIEHVLIDFTPDVRDKLVIGDKMQIRAVGTGLAFTNFEGVKLMNLSPRLLKAMSPQVVGKYIEVGVTHLIPAAVMASGIGKDSAHTGDYDIQLFDQAIVKKHRLNSLRFGDIVAIMDADTTFGRTYLTGAVTIAIVVHGVCHTAGHGPGATSLMTSAKGLIKPIIRKDANIASLLKLIKR